MIFSQVGLSDLFHRECGKRLERVMIYERGPGGEPGYHCWHCSKTIALAVLLYQMRLRGRWASHG